MRADSPTDAPIRQIDAVQWLRAIAVLLVIGLHSIELVKFRHDSLGDHLGVLSSTTFPDQFGASGVDLFFVISGFVMALLLERIPHGNWKSFIGARIRRIVPLYWFATISMVALLLIIHAPIDRHSALASLTIWPIPGRATVDPPILVVGWSLAFELAFYCALIPALFAPARLRGLTALLIVTMLAATGQLLHPDDNLVALFLNAIWYEFALGLLLYLWWRRGLDRTLARVGAVLGGVLLLTGIFYAAVPETRPFAIYNHKEAFDRALYWGIPWTAVLAGALSVDHRGWLSNVLIRIGDASYALYLTHMLVMTSLLWLLPPFVAAPDLVPIIALSLALVLGLAAHAFVELPVLAYLKTKPMRSQSASTPSSAASVRAAH